ncbi:MAG: tRNA dihydrouridine(20/20a) synthase DusA [Alphaproteobacteria bacterium]
MVNGVVDTLGAKFRLTVSVAPMVARTDRHFRYLLRGITRSALLYTEMLTAASVCRRPELLAFDVVERPLVLQLAGVGGDELYRAARAGIDYGYDGINLNFGCPSRRAEAGGFGACMMATPSLAGEAFRCAAEASAFEFVSVKCRLGLNGEDEEESFYNFTQALYAAGCRSFVVHARKAWLGGLSTAQNRTRPPLNYALVHRVAGEFADADFVLNGGFESVESACGHADGLAGAMLGRAVWRDPWCLAGVDGGDNLEGEELAARQAELRVRMRDYFLEKSACGEATMPILRAMARLGAGRPGARRWRMDLARVQRAELDIAALAL